MLGFCKNSFLGIINHHVDSRALASHFYIVRRLLIVQCLKLVKYVYLVKEVVCYEV